MTRLAWLLLAWGIIILTVVDGAYLSVVFSHLPHQERQQPNESKQDKERLNGPVVSFLIESLDASERFIEKHEKFFIVLFTGAIAYFTFILWSATDAMQVISNRQLGEMKTSLNIARDSANAAREAVDLGREELAATKDTSRLELRPYVGVDKLFFTLEGTDINQSLLSFYPTASILKLGIKNFGKTPAYSVNVFTLILAATPDEPFRPTFDDPIIERHNIYPDQSHVVELDVSRFPTVRYNLVGFVVYGRITYYDPLGKMDWTFDFC